MDQGLYEPGEFKDNCGFGLIAHMKGQKSHHLLQTAIESLMRLTHRGGIAADGKTGDGCGLLLQKPDSFLRSVAKELFNFNLSADYGVGMVFLNQDSVLAEKAKACLSYELLTQGLKVVGWRNVPINPLVCGPIAYKSLPKIEQVFIDGGLFSSFDLSVKLFIARRKAEIKLRDDYYFYVCSLSNTVLSYKGLVLPSDLTSFYSDLSNPAMETSICLYHQRFSTNTSPLWPLAHPFRFLAHNGEINTIQGNRNWSVARTRKFANKNIPNIEEIVPLINRRGSDSSSMDNMLELLLMGGMDIFRALRMMIPPSWQNVDSMDADLRAFYECNSMHMEPWEGPAGLVLTDGRYGICMLDRNGLRPSRWVINRNNYINVASEIGVYNYKPEDVVAKGRIGPGEIFAVDTLTGQILNTNDIDNILKNKHPYKKWLTEKAYRLQTDRTNISEKKAGLPSEQLQTYMKMFQVTLEERTQIIYTLCKEGQEAVGSMGDDTPMAVLSNRVRPLYDYFRQQFAQVTNPPIDSLRESVVMSLETCLGAEIDVFGEAPEHASRVILSSPILSPSKFRKLHLLNRPGFNIEVLSLNYDKNISLNIAIENLTKQAEKAVRNGCVVLVLTDRDISSDMLPIHAAMATGAVHHHLTKVSLRCDSNIVVETATARDPHHFAVLVGFGASAVYPYLSYAILDNLIATGEMSIEPPLAYKNYRKGLNKGLLKIISKMGISTIASYRGAQLFEAIGVSKKVVDLCFCGVPSRIEGASFEDFQNDQAKLALEAWSFRKKIQFAGSHKYVHGGEYHAYNPEVVKALQEAVKTGKYKNYQYYSALVNNRPIATLRDLLTFDNAQFTSISIEEVESLQSILMRFDSAGMSLGALSPEAHETLATAMNRIGGRSNSGEGGEDPLRFGTERNSKIKQVASGRFGVTPAYLRSAEELQIKIAQGAKPGEGGQLPGRKVNELIAKLRYCEPGVTLISPPPHHDVYSIEDLAQLIFDLKQVNPNAKVSVKLVSEPGVGTIAAGVTKAHADLITISGYDGGTGASPLTSIHHAGSPWELGLSEAQQALRINHLREKVRVQVDGGLKTGLDVIKAAILGAESFGFGTGPMVAIGCKYLRICHLNNCATGVATQNEMLRELHFKGEVESLMNFFKFVAQETRELLAFLGVRKLEDIIGRTELLKALPGETSKHQHLNFDSVLRNKFIDNNEPQFCKFPNNDPFDKGMLAEKMVSDILPAIQTKLGGEYFYSITNCDRSIGARLSGEIAAIHGNLGMSECPVTLKLSGTAGQSLGVWNAGGLNIYLEGDANDYVGKGMAGGKIVIYPPKNSSFKSQETTIIGNTCLYGATGGKLFASGGAGERFAVRNSGAHAVVESVGDHCCEYMTGGLVTVLGKTGYNFAAGMTGGSAYVLDVLDPAHTFFDKCNHELVDLHRINGEAMEAYRHHLFEVLEEYVAETGSLWGTHIIENYSDYLRNFWLIVPKAASLDKLLRETRSSPE